MPFKNRRGRAYNPKKNPQVPNAQEIPAALPITAQTFEFSDFSEGTKQALKEILDRRTITNQESDNC